MAAIADLMAEIRAGAVAALTGSSTKLAAACDHMQEWADESAQVEPAPDPDVNTHWQRLVSYVDQAASLCSEGAKTEDPALIEQMTETWAEKVMPELQELTEAMSDATGIAPPSTVATTTTEPEPEEHDITGTMTLRDDESIYHATAQAKGLCLGMRGYDDLQTGAPVVVRDGTGATIATGSLGVGISDQAAGKCIWPVEVYDVPESDFYEIEVTHRGGLTYSAAEMERMDWTVELSIGS